MSKSSDSAAGSPAKKPGEEKTSLRILDGARRHFFAHGFRGVTMDDLASELGMSKKTLYAHFSSKTVLLAAVISDKLRRVEADMKSVIEGDAEDFPETLRAMLVCMRRQTEEIHPAFVRDVQREEPELFARVRDGRRKLIQHYFSKLLTEGRKAGTIRRDIPTELMIEILVGSVDAIIIPDRMEEFGLTPQTGFTSIISIFLEGALVRSGGARR